MEIEKVFLLLATQKRGLFFCSQAKVILQAVDTQAVASSSISSSLEKAFFVKSTLKLAWTFSCHPITTWTLENPSSVNRGECASLASAATVKGDTLFPHGETMLMILQWHRSRFIVRKAWISGKSLLKSSPDLVPPSKICTVPKSSKGISVSVSSLNPLEMRLFKPFSD